MIEISLIIGLILLAFTVLNYISDKLTIPYTILLLIFGFIAKELFHLLGIDFHINLNSEFIYSIFLPFLLFGSALHINFHQFRLQYKTISFLATFGMMIALTIIGGLTSYLLKWDLVTGLLFGAIISATDPIAVLALFKSIGGPKRLALIADGESMLNDATAVVIFRLLLTLSISHQHFSHFTLLESFGSFLYVFFGSVFFGLILGYIFSIILNRVENSLLNETTLTLGAALLIFSSAEYYLHLSGVISAVIAGLFVGNFGGLRSPSIVSHFVQEFWDYIGHITISFVFFFSTLDLKLDFLIRQIDLNLLVIGIVLLSRAISVYLSIYITNRHPFFKDEPNIPLSWQHILNWGGLRGVIPLVLVYSLPDSFAYKNMMFNLTFAVLLFSLFINGSTIILLLKKLKLHIPTYHERIKKIHNDLFNYDEAVEVLEKGKIIGISKSTIREQLSKWRKKERKILINFENINPVEYRNTLTLQSLNIERKIYENLLASDELNEAAFYELDAQLDLQWDAVEYPEVNLRLTDKNGKIKSALRFRQRLLSLRRWIANFPYISKFFGINKDFLYFERFMLVRARIIGSNRVLSFLAEIKKNCSNKNLQNEIKNIINKYRFFVTKAKKEIRILRKEFLIKPFELKILNHSLKNNYSKWIM